MDQQDEVMYPLIRKNDGRLVKRIGDGIMLAFSAPGRRGVVDGNGS